MKTNQLAVIWLCMLTCICCSCNKDLIEYQKDDLRISIEKGDAWLHDFPLFLGIKKKNTPQIAIWAEDTSGNYLSTIYVTHKIATQSWQAAGKNRRKEALPVWCHTRGIQYPDGLYLPTKDQPLTDGITGATPQGSFSLKLKPMDGRKQFTVKIEVNHSTDFNENYPESAQEEDSNYSGGDSGSGQPALVYAAKVDLTTGSKEFEAILSGHSSPDGTNGIIYPDLTSLTTALEIIKRITITIQQ